MPRIGINPARGKLSDYRPSRVTLAMLTHIPDQSGYFAKRFEVMRLSLESMIANSPAGTDVLVFDNGSCKEVVDYLRAMRDAGKVQYLLLSSRNVGKIGAFQILFRAAPGEIVAYSDDDILFLPGWLDESLKIMDGFPKVGMVSGYYLRTQMRHATDSTLRYIEGSDVAVERGSLITREWELHYIENYGRTAEQYEEYVAGIDDIMIARNGARAFVSATHMQFLIPKRVILDALPREWGGQLMGQMRELDIEVDHLGYLRLSTSERVTRFLGNAISAENASLAQSFGLQASVSSQGPRSGKILARLNRSKPFHYLFQGLYNRLYAVINSQD